MTEMLKKEFSRKSFLKGGGAMVVGFSALGWGRPRLRPATRRSTSGARSDFLPNLNTIDAWIAIRADNTVIVTHGEPEFAGTPTGILMLVAEELDVGMDQMVYASPETWLNATGGGGGSGGISSRSTQARAAAAYAKQELLKMASTKLGAPVASLSVDRRRGLRRQREGHLRRADRRQELQLHDAGGWPRELQRQRHAAEAR